MPVEVVSNPTVASILKRLFNPQLYYVSSLSTAASVNISSRCAYGSKNPKKLEQKNLWSGATDPQACVEINVYLDGLIHSSIFLFSFV